MTDPGPDCQSRDREVGHDQTAADCGPPGVDLPSAASSSPVEVHAASEDDNYHPLDPANWIRAEESGGAVKAFVVLPIPERPDDQGTATYPWKLEVPQRLGWWKTPPIFAFRFGINSHALVDAEPVLWRCRPCTTDAHGNVVPGIPLERKKPRRWVFYCLEDIDESLAELVDEAQPTVYAELCRTMQRLREIQPYIDELPELDPVADSSVTREQFIDRNLRENPSCLHMRCIRLLRRIRSLAARLLQHKPLLQSCYRLGEGCRSCLWAETSRQDFHVLPVVDALRGFPPIALEYVFQTGDVRPGEDGIADLILKEYQECIAGLGLPDKGTFEWDSGSVPGRRYQKLICTLAEWLCLLLGSIRWPPSDAAGESQESRPTPTAPEQMITEQKAPVAATEPITAARPEGPYPDDVTISILEFLAKRQVPVSQSRMTTELRVPDPKGRHSYRSRGTIGKKMRGLEAQRPALIIRANGDRSKSGYVITAAGRAFLTQFHASKLAQ
jgi:hypothetical protein